MKLSKSRRKKQVDLRQKARVHVPRNYAWRVLDNLVDDLSDCLTDSEVSEVKSVVRSQDYTRYLALSEAWGPQSITSGDNKQTQVFARYQIASLLKKFQFSGDSQSRRDTAKEKFLAAEQACLQYNREGFTELACLEEEWELSAYTYARNFLEKLLGNTLPERAQLTLWSRHGPGSNLDTKNRSVSLYDKYKNWPYSCTKDALRTARLSIQDDERWLGALEDNYREVNNLPKHVIIDQKAFWSDVLKVVPGNLIAFVPKNALTERSIAIEPCMNLYLQLGVDGFMRRRLKRWGIDLDDQQKNQELARQGSKYWRTEDPFVTLDLAAASDTISKRVCYQLLPVQWYNYLMDIRSPSGELDGEMLSYEKISSMGNGYTFALESAIFTAIIYGVSKAVTGSYNRDEVSVFGDDLICRKSISSKVIRMLNLCGFSVNHEKSFFEGPFRESCGADWFDGTPVRPVFLTDQPSTVGELWCDSNRIRRILTLRVYGWEFKTTRLIESWIPAFFADFTGPYSDEEFDSYKHVPLPSVKEKHGLRKFKRMVIRPKRLRGENFLFRKLMHSLQAAPPPNQFQRNSWGGMKVTGAGSRFTVTRSNAVTVGYKRSPVSYWQDEYADFYPLWLPKGTPRN